MNVKPDSLPSNEMIRALNNHGRYIDQSTYLLAMDAVKVLRQQSLDTERLMREREVWKSKAVHRGVSASRLRAALENARKAILTVDSILAAAGYSPDSSARNLLMCGCPDQALSDESDSAPETSERCHFRAFGRFACELPKDHAGDHTCRLPEDPPQQAFTDQARVDEQVFQDMLLSGLGFTMHAPAGRRRLPPDAVTIDLDKLHASEAGAGGEPGLATQATVTESRQADRCLATGVPRQIDASARDQGRVDVLTNEQCDRIISGLQAQEWSGISRDDVRLWDGLITSARLESSPKASREPCKHGDRTGHCRRCLDSI